MVERPVTAADGDDMRSLRPQLTARKHRAHTQSSFPRRPQRTGAKGFSIFEAAPRNLGKPIRRSAPTQLRGDALRLYHFL